MVIGVNGYEAVVPRVGFDPKTGLPIRVGSGEYSFELLRELYNIDRKNKYYIFLPVSPTSDLPKQSKNWRYIIVKSQKAWTMLALPRRLLSKNPKLDVFFSPTHYAPLFLPCPLVLSVMDLSYLKYPELFRKKDLYQLKFWTKWSIARAWKVLTISKSSKDDIIKYYKLQGDKVVVTYPGIKAGRQMLKVKNTSQDLKLLKDKYGIDKEYVLFVGTLQPRKNIVRLIEAFSRIQNSEFRIQNLSLIIVGRKGWMWEDILRSPEKFGVKDRVKFLENVSDEDLPFFYQNALCFVLPSLYEGFGLPILEAMVNGCPVIASNISSLPEAGGEAALYVDPAKVDDITRNLELIIKTPGLRQEMIKKGYEQVKKFSWEKTAKETLSVLQELGNKK